MLKKKMSTHKTYSNTLKLILENKFHQELTLLAFNKNLLQILLSHEKNNRRTNKTASVRTKI